MSVDATPPTGPTSAAPEVMASVDEQAGESRFVIADISRDGAWVSAPAAAATTLAAWR
ncbi:MAG: hypothetical protein ABEJ76_05955 [Halanaeroarchaeum sp.]